MKTKLFWLGVAVGLGSAAVFFLNRKRRMPLPWSAWQPGLVQVHGQEEGTRLLNRAYKDWEVLLAEYPHPLPKPPLRQHLVNNIMTGTAMYRVLLEAHDGNREAALSEIEPLFEAWTHALYGGTMRAFRILPFSFSFFRLATKMVLRRFPADEWGISWVEDNPRRIAYNTLTCPYVTHLKDYGVPELGTYFCQIDEWMGEMLLPGIKFRRTQTLARGGTVCDYSFENLG